MRTATLVTLALLLAAAFALSGCPVQPRDGTGFGAPNRSAATTPGMGDGGRDRIHMTPN